MKSVLSICLVLTAALFAAVNTYAQDDTPPAKPDLERLKKALPYLSSVVPEQKLAAEQLIARGAEANFDALVTELPGLPLSGRESLLAILVGTSHEGRSKLCIGVLCEPASRRAERVIALRGLRTAEAETVLELLDARINREGVSRFELIQCCGILGGVRAARAQGMAEKLLGASGDDEMLRFAAEDALLRSTLESPFAQPSWERYQERHETAPKVTLREMQAALEGLALPSSSQRANATAALSRIIDGDPRVLLALARSPWVERNLYALAMLPAVNLRALSLPALWVMLDLVTTSEQAVALRAMQAAIAGAPPSAENMRLLRPAASPDSLARLESILEGLSRGGDLVRLRDQKKLLGAQLRPKLARVGAFDPEARALMDEYRQVKSELDKLEEAWEQGWKREFEAEILGVGK